MSKSKSLSARQRVKARFSALQASVKAAQPRKCKLMQRLVGIRVKDNGTLTCGLNGLCILKASGSPPACENTTRDGGGR